MIFGLLVKRFGRFIKTKLYVSRGDFRLKQVFEIESFFSIIWSLWADDFQDSVEKCPKCHQSCILRVQRKIVPKHCFGEQKFNTFGFSGKKSQNFGGKVSRRNFWGNKFCIKKGNWIHFLNLEEKVSNSSTKLPSRAVRTTFYVTRWWNLGKKLLEVYSSLIFSNTEQKFSDFTRRVFAGLSTVQFTRPKGVSTEISVWNLRFTFTDFKR